MSLSRRTAVLIGILLVAGMVFGVLSSVTALEYPDYLSKLSSLSPQVLLAVFSQFAMATVYLLVAVLFYPIVKTCDERVALGYLGFRFIAAAFLYIGMVSLLLLLFVSRAYVDAAQLDQPQIQVLGDAACWQGLDESHRCDPDMEPRRVAPLFMLPENEADSHMVVGLGACGYGVDPCRHISLHVRCHQNRLTNLFCLEHTDGTV